MPVNKTAMQTLLLVTQSGMQTIIQLTFAHSPLAVHLDPLELCRVTGMSSIFFPYL